MRVLPPLSDLRRMTRADVVSTLNACTRHQREEIARIEGPGENAQSCADREHLARHRNSLKAVMLRAHLSRISVGDPA